MSSDYRNIIISNSAIDFSSIAEDYTNYIYNIYEYQISEKYLYFIDTSWGDMFSTGYLYLYSNETKLISWCDCGSIVSLKHFIPSETILDNISAKMEISDDCYYSLSDPKQYDPQCIDTMCSIIVHGVNCTLTEAKDICKIYADIEYKTSICKKIK